MLTPQQAYHEELPEGYIDDLSMFASTMYCVVVYDNYLPGAAPVVSNQVKNIDKLLIRGIQDFLLRRQGFTNIRAQPSHIETT